VTAADDQNGLCNFATKVKTSVLCICNICESGRAWDCMLLFCLALWTFRSWKRRDMQSIQWMWWWRRNVASIFRALITWDGRTCGWWYTTAHGSCVLCCNDVVHRVRRRRTWQQRWMTLYTCLWKSLPSRLMTWVL